MHTVVCKRFCDLMRQPFFTKQKIKPADKIVSTPAIKCSAKPEIVFWKTVYATLFVILIQSKKKLFCSVIFLKKAACIQEQICDYFKKDLL